jgi:hypothetical protein
MSKFQTKMSKHVLTISEWTIIAKKKFFGCFNATFNNISAISWRPVLVVMEATLIKN